MSEELVRLGIWIAALKGSLGRVNLTIPERNAILRSYAVLEVVKEVYLSHADDLCWMDIDLIFAAAGLQVPDRSVGDKTKMIVNCGRFVETMCSSGKWKSYAELEAENQKLLEACKICLKIFKGEMKASAPGTGCLNTIEMLNSVMRLPGAARFLKK